MESAVFTLGFILAVVGASPCPPRLLSANYSTAPSDNYPRRIIQDLMSEINITLIYDMHKTHLLGNREGLEDFQNPCESHASTEKIYEIIDENGKNRTVVQLENRFTQEIRMETCCQPGQLTEDTIRSSDEVLKQHLHAEEYGLTFVCYQETMSYMFLALSLDKKKLEPVKSSEIPVYCACRFKTD